MPPAPGQSWQDEGLLMGPSRLGWARGTVLGAGWLPSTPHRVGPVSTGPAKEQGLTKQELPWGRESDLGASQVILQRLRHPQRPGETDPIQRKLMLVMHRRSQGDRHRDLGSPSLLSLSPLSTLPQPSS